MPLNTPRRRAGLTSFALAASIALAFAAGSAQAAPDAKLLAAANAQQPAVIDTLKSLGCRFALDDFGTGLSSFSYLKTLPVDYLKIDGGFVRGLVGDDIDQAMVEAVHHIGRIMGLETIAEWVESGPILLKLKQIGVNYGQGYALGHPRPLSDQQTLVA